MVYNIKKETLDKIIKWRKDLFLKLDDGDIYVYTDGDMVDKAEHIFDDIIEQTIGKE